MLFAFPLGGITGAGEFEQFVGEVNIRVGHGDYEFGGGEQTGGLDAGTDVTVGIIRESWAFNPGG